jgi:hypothetical protein
MSSVIIWPEVFMVLKKFTLLYLGILVLGLTILSFKDVLFIIGSESQLADVSHHVPGAEQTFYKISGAYKEKSLKPAISYNVNGINYTYIPEYSCKEGCHDIGSKITIFYKKDHPQEVLVSSLAGMWKYKFYFLIVMGVLLLTALPYVYINKQHGSESNG